MRILLALTAAACMAAVPAVGQYNTPQYNQDQNRPVYQNPYYQHRYNPGYYHQQSRQPYYQNQRYYNNQGYYQNGYYRNGQNQSANPSVRREENRMESANNINDNVNIVNGPRLENVTPSSVLLTWTTNNVAASRVEYGTNPNNPQQHAYEPGGSRAHNLQLNNLQPGRTYYYQIQNNDGKTRFEGTFHTPRG